MKFKKFVKVKPWTEFNKIIVEPLTEVRAKILISTTEEELLYCIKYVEVIAVNLESIVDYCSKKLDDSPNRILSNMELNEEGDLGHLKITKDSYKDIHTYNTIAEYFNYILEHANKFQPLYYTIA